MDGMVRLYYMSSDQPVKVFAGHEKRVFNVIYNLQMPNIIASGSDDLTIRVWDIE